MREVKILVLLSMLAACDTQEEAAKPDPGPRPVKVVRVAQTTDAVEYSYPAEVLPAEEAALSFRVSGQIIDLPIREMNDIEKGDLIARLDPRDFRSNVEQIEAQLATERSRLDAMTAGARAEDIAAFRANVDAAEAQVASARAKAERTLTEYRKGVVAKEQLDGDIAALKAAEAQLAAQRQELSKGETGSRREDVDAQLAVIANLETQLRNAGDTQADTELRAPFDGVIAERAVDNFANVQAKETIVILQNLSTLELSFDVPGPDVARLGPRREFFLVEAILDASPETRFPAEVVEFSGRADAATQTFEGRASIERPTDMVILPGMTGRVVVTDRGGATASLSIPAAAVGAAPGGEPIVWVVDENNRVSMRPVTLGPMRDSVVEVTEGLAADETVVVAGLGSMQPDLEVRPVAKIGN